MKNTCEPLMLRFLLDLILFPLQMDAGTAQQHQASGACTDSWQAWSTELAVLDLVARIIFTLAVMSDLWSIRVSDNFEVVPKVTLSL